MITGDVCFMMHEGRQQGTMGSQPKLGFAPSGRYCPSILDIAGGTGEYAECMLQASAAWVLQVTRIS